MFVSFQRSLSFSVCRWIANGRDCVQSAVFYVAASKTSLRMLNKQVIGGKCWCFQLTALLLLRTCTFSGSSKISPHPRQTEWQRREEAKKKFNRRNCRSEAYTFVQGLFCSLVLQFKHNYSQILSYFIFPQCRCDGV